MHPADDFCLPGAIYFLFCIAFCVTFCYPILDRRDDENRIEVFDETHSLLEDRYITIGEINGIAVIVMVVYTERENAIRLISARKATKREWRLYYDCSQGN